MPPFFLVFIMVMYAMAVGAESYALFYFFIGQLKSASSYKFVDTVFFRANMVEVNHRRVGEPTFGTR